MLLNILIPLLGIVLDQIVKYWASTDLQAIGTIPIWEGVFHLTYCENTGAAFSMFTGQRWMLLAVTVVLLAGLLWALYKNWMQNAFGRMSLRLIISGAIGNMIDRILLGYVVDMFDFRLINFAIFNVADIFICVGGGLFVLYLLMELFPAKKKAETTAKSEETPDAET